MLTKTEVQAIAEQQGLVTAAKKDSQGICFVGSVGIKDFWVSMCRLNPAKSSTKCRAGHRSPRGCDILYRWSATRAQCRRWASVTLLSAKIWRATRCLSARNLDDESMWREHVELSDIHWINDAHVLTIRCMLGCDIAGNYCHAPSRVTNYISLKLNALRQLASPPCCTEGDECIGGGIVV